MVADFKALQKGLLAYESIDKKFERNSNRLRRNHVWPRGVLHNETSAYAGAIEIIETFAKQAKNRPFYLIQEKSQP